MRSNSAKVYHAYSKLQLPATFLKSKNVASKVQINLSPLAEV